MQELLPLDPDRLLAETGLARVDYQQSVTSTQDLAQQWAARATAADLPLAVVAENQTAGRGREERRWWTGAGSLALSLVFDPDPWGLVPAIAPQRALVAAVAVVDVLSPVLPRHTVGIHWPNDVYVDQRKIAGLLLDVARQGRHILGLGLNVNNSLRAAPPELCETAVSLVDLTDCCHDRTALLVSLVRSLEAAFRRSAADPLHLGQRFDQLCLQVGRQLTVRIGRAQITGRCLGIAPDGALRLETTAGPRALYTGTVVK